MQYLFLKRMSWQVRPDDEKFTLKVHTISWKKDKQGEDNIL